MFMDVFINVFFLPSGNNDTSVFVLIISGPLQQLFWAKSASFAKGISSACYFDNFLFLQYDDMAQ